MDIFFHILVKNILPMMIMVSLGIVLEKIFHLDIRTLSKLNFYLFSPVLIFILIYETAIPAEQISSTVIFFLIFMALQYCVVELVIRMKGYKPSMKSAMRNSVLFYNSANYAIPLNQLVFASNKVTLGVQIIIMMFQSLIPNTYGVYSVNKHKASLKQVWKTILGMPVIYVIPLAFIFRANHIAIPEAIYIPLNYIYDAFIGTALLTLGVQLGQMSWKISKTVAVDVIISGVLRLIAGPLLAWLVTIILSIDGILAAALIVSSAVPTSLSSVLLAVEFENEKEFASQAVFVSTLVSIVTVTIVIFCLNIS